MKLRLMLQVAGCLIVAAALGCWLLMAHDGVDQGSVLRMGATLGGAALVISASLAWVWFVEAKANSKAQLTVHKWAATYVYAVLKIERPLHTGPFNFWTSSKKMVYEVTIRDEGGCVRKAWVRVGGSFLGVFHGDDIEVKWQ